MNLYAIYSRVQKLGGYECIGDNRVWKQIFEDIAATSVNGSAINSMTRKKYERILLPFERYERELLNLASLAPNASPEITISTISKAAASSSRPRSSSPAVEIIPMKNGAVTGDNIELTKEQMCEIQNIIKQKDNQMVHHLNSLSNDGISLPISVIVRPQSSDDNTLRAKYNNASDSGNNMFPFGRSHPSVVGVSQEESSFYNNKMSRQSKGKQERKTPYPQAAPQQQPAGSSQPVPSEKENIPLMLSKQSTTIIPISKDGQVYGDHVIELVDSDDEGQSSQVIFFTTLC